MFVERRYEPLTKELKSGTPKDVSFVMIWNDLRKQLRATKEYHSNSDKKLKQQRACREVYVKKYLFSINSIQRKSYE